MPIHDYVCRCGVRESRFCKVADLEVAQLCVCGKVMERKISAPMVAGDLQPYLSPVDGREISGRRARKEDLLRNNCVEYEPSFREYTTRAKARDEEKLERAVEETVDAEISRMPARKREKLIEELSAGASAEVVRKTAH